jgi:hypothetical protein
MKNIHIEHPEDSILTGDLAVLDAFLMPHHLSVKYDGAPAIVWGTNPATGNQFVGTKSVFNKVKIKINETHADIDQNHNGPVAEILHACLDFLPDEDGIIQGDFIGFGGSDEFTPNCITYQFPDTVGGEIIVAPHTRYEAESDLRDAVASPLKDDQESTDCCLFVQPAAFADFVGSPLQDRIEFAKQVSTLVDFEDEKAAAILKKDLNAFIRDGDEIVPEQFANYQLVRLWVLVKAIKEQALDLCCHGDGPDAWIQDEAVDAEGYVMHTEAGSWKLVDREVFSYANFSMGVGR